jgi:methyl coenzyme M reductase subunit C
LTDGEHRRRAVVEFFRADWEVVGIPGARHVARPACAIGMGACSPVLAAERLL